MYISLMGKILNSPKGVKSDVLDSVIISAAHVAPVTIHAKIIIGNQSCVTVCEQILQHMWHRSVKFVNKEGLYDDHQIS